MKDGQLPPREFLRNVEFEPERVMQRYPNARNLTLNRLFISHSGSDTQRILEDIIEPVIFHRLPADGYFMHSRGSGGAEAYRELVQGALHWCDMFMVVLSEMSVSSEWVQAELEWALERSRPILVARLDQARWADLDRQLQLPERLRSAMSWEIFDFGADRQLAARGLAVALDALMKKFPRGGRYGSGRGSPKT